MPLIDPETATKLFSPKAFLETLKTYRGFLTNNSSGILSVGDTMKAEKAFQ